MLRLPLRPPAPPAARPERSTAQPRRARLVRDGRAGGTGGDPRPPIRSQNTRSSRAARWLTGWRPAAAECTQMETPIDLASTRTAMRQRAMEVQATIGVLRHPYSQPTPGREDVPRWSRAGTVTVSRAADGVLSTVQCPVSTDESYTPSARPRLGPALPGVQCRARHFIGCDCGTR